MKILGFMPTLGRPPLVEQILMMWKLQSHQDRELLVLDTGNQMPECTGDRWRIVHQGETPWSMGTCCNRGIRLLDSDAICRIDDDDIYFPWHLEACAAALEHHPWACPSSVWDRFDPHEPPCRVRTYGDPTPVDVAYSGCWSF